MHLKDYPSLVRDTSHAIQKDCTLLTMEIRITGRHLGALMHRHLWP